MTRHPLVIVGAGPAGMAAAIAAASLGVNAIVLDENPRIGGQIYRQPATTSGGVTASGAGKLLLDRFQSLQQRITVLNEATVWGIFPPRRVAVSRESSWDMIYADELILAPGAYEYVPPFPGWTLPGVMTPGGGQLLVKTMGVLPGRRALLAGTGPFLLVVAEQLHRAGMEVVGIVEATSTLALVRCVPRMLTHLGLLREGIAQVRRLRRAGVPIHRGELVIEARGPETLREVVIAPCGADWRPERTRSRTIEVDTLCIGYGFVPRTQLAQLAGCCMHFANELGGWVPERDPNLQTTVRGVTVAGDGSGVAGALVAQEEGTLAGLAAAHRLSAIDATAFARARKPVVQRLKKLRRFRVALDRLSRVRRGLDDLAGPETVVCRCEDVTRGELETGVSYGGRDLRTLKVMTRLGMGPCQGRMCWPAAARWLAAQTGQSLADLGPLSVRPPTQPVCVGELAQDASLLETPGATA